MFHIGSWLSWQAIRLMMPKAPPGLGYALAVIAAGGLLIFYGYHLGTEGRAAAVAERDLVWIKKIAEQNNEHERDAERARLAAERVTPTPGDRAERLRLCEQSPTCRSRAGGGQ